LGGKIRINKNSAARLFIPRNVEIIPCRFFNYFVVKEERKKNVVNHMEEKKKFEKV
jgi:hypothetical protein